MNKILVLAAHPDDGELSSGGTIKRFRDENKEVWYVAFSPCIKSLPKGSSAHILFDELKQALAYLSVDEDNIITFSYPVREFPKYRQDILEDLIRLKKQLRPDLVLLPNSNDVHQDHHQLYLEGVRAFKETRLLGYELPWNSLSFQSNFHIRLSSQCIDSKIQALKVYSSQNHRSYFKPEFIRSWAVSRGIQANTEFAEAFQMIKWFV